MTASETDRSAPDPLGTASAAEFVQRLKQLRLWAGQPSLRQLRAAGGKTTLPDGSVVDALPVSTISDLLSGKGLPRLPRMDFVDAFVNACLTARNHEPAEINAHISRWREAWRQLVKDERAFGKPPVKGARNDLPACVADFTGREEEMQRLLDLLNVQNGAEALVISAIDGMAGVGKTTLAVHAAHRLADRFPDAQLFLDLHAHTADYDVMDSATALHSLLRALGVPSDKIPEGLEARAGLWRAELADRKALVVLDNAANAAQIRALLPGNPQCMVLITSRYRLSDLDSARRFSLGVLPAADAATLFARILDDDRAVHEARAVDDMVRLCGYLPLAIRITAARLRSRPAWTIAHLTQRMRVEQRRLSELAVGDRDVATAFRLSYRHLNTGQRRLFRLLGLLPGVDFDVHVAAAIASIAVDDAERLLEELVDVHLLQQPAFDRYSFHDLLRAYAGRLTNDADSDADRRAALTRVFDYYRHAAGVAVDSVLGNAAHRRLETPLSDFPIPDFSVEDCAQAWLECERPNLVAVASQASRIGCPAHSCHFSAILWRYFFLRGHHSDAIVLHTDAAVAARQIGDRNVEGHILGNLGTVYWRLGRHDEALTQLGRSLVLARETVARDLEGRVLGNLGSVYCRLGRHNEALDIFGQALVVAREIADRDLEGHVLTGLGTAHKYLGRYDQTVAQFQQALQLAHATGNYDLKGCTLRSLGGILWCMKRYCEASVRFRQALDLARDIGDRDLEVEALNGLGETIRASGAPRQALTHFQQAFAIASDIGNRYERARADDCLAQAHHDLDLPLQARDHWERALAIYADLDVPEADQVRRKLDMVCATDQQTPG